VAVTNDLLSFRERINENLSSGQLADILDDLLFNALRPIFFNTDHVEQTLIEMLPFVASNARRKFTNMPREDFVDTLFTIVASHDKEAKFVMLRKIGLERTVYISCLKSFDALTLRHETMMRQYLSTAPKLLKERHDLLSAMTMLEQRLGLRSEASLFTVRAEAAFWFAHALDFKMMIIEKFIRLAFQDSQKARAETGLHVDDDSLFKDYIVSINKAITKFDATKGTLTSFIRWWFMDAKTSGNHEYDIAYSIPTAQRAKLLASGMINFAQQVDDDTTETLGSHESNVLDKIIDKETNALHGNIAISADPHKFASLIHDLSYTFSDADKAALRATQQKV